MSDKGKEKNITIATASPKIWRLLRTNTSAVYLHVLVIKTNSKIQQDSVKLKSGYTDLESLIKESDDEEDQCSDSSFGSGSSSGSKSQCMDTKSLPYDDINPK